MPAPRNLVGQTFNRLTVVELVEHRYNGKTKYYLCRCECGNEKVIYGCSVSSGKTKSCGCLHREKSRKYAESTINFQYAQHKKAGNDRGYGHLNFGDWWALVSGVCRYCGESETRNYIRTAGKNTKIRVSGDDLIKYDVKMVGIDRLNSSVGYTPENCVPCCGRCNSMKMQMGECEFIDQIRKVYEYTRAS